jgi:hypothetical protein
MSARMVTLAALLAALGMNAQPVVRPKPPLTHVHVPPGQVIVVAQDDDKPFPPPADPAADARWFQQWESRAERFESFRQKPAEADKLWAMQTLYNEAAFMQRHFTQTGEALGEAYGAYYIDLGLFVAQLKDPRSIQALAVATDIAPVVSSTLAEFGDPAVDAVVHTLNNPFLRESGAFTLGKFLQGSNERRIQVAPAKMMKIRGTLMKAVVSGTPSLQRNAVRAMGHVKLTDDERKILRSVETSAKTSPMVKREILRSVKP